MNPTLDFEITDDSGFLALLDPKTYASFVQRDLDFDVFRAHAINEMRKKHMLIWGTGMENIWRVRIAFQPQKDAGFRERSAVIHVSDGSLLLTNYENLGMVYTFPDEHLPQLGDHLISVRPGRYQARVIQMIDPDDFEAAPREEFDFLIECVPAKDDMAPWTAIPWCERYT